jgi:N-acetylglucosaminyl-diphospho-decaprenol L-rhamnosyltransferase
MTMSVSVAIPSLAGGDQLVGMVQRLLDHTEAPVELIVVDNGLDRSVVARLHSAPVRVLTMPRNVGFGAAINKAAEVAGGEGLVVLNDDLVPEPGFIDRLTEPLQARTEMAAGVLLQHDRPDTIETAGIELDAALGPYDYLQNEPVSHLDQNPPPPLGPSGGAAAYRRDVFEEAGGFDEGLFAYYEDVDLAIRLRAAGARCALAPGARAVHSVSRTLGYHSVEKAVLVGYGRGYLLRKYGVLSRPLLGLRTIAVELGTAAVLARRHRSWAPAKARLRGWRKCEVRHPRPPKDLMSVGLSEGLRRRYLRSIRPGAA